MGGRSEGSDCFLPPSFHPTNGIRFSSNVINFPVVSDGATALPAKWVGVEGKGRERGHLDRVMEADRSLSGSLHVSGWLLHLARPR